MNLVRTFNVLSLLPLLLAGCTSNKISVVHTGQSSPSPGSAILRSYPSLTDVSTDYRIHGMIAVGILPLMNNKADARETVLRNAAAGLGVNSLVGFKHLTEHYGGYGVSCAILANTGMLPTANEVARPRFIVCALPATIRTDKTTEAGHLQSRLLAELSYRLTEKGYYTYSSASSDLTAQGLEAITPQELKQPLGIEPDFVLKCEITDGKYLFTQALLTRVVLYDLKERRNVWEYKEGEGKDSEPPVVQWGLLEQLTSPNKKWFSKDRWSSDNPGHPKEQVSTAIKKATKKLPPVPGHRQLKM